MLKGWERFCYQRSSLPKGYLLRYRSAASHASAPGITTAKMSVRLKNTSDIPLLLVLGLTGIGLLVAVRGSSGGTTKLLPILDFLTSPLACLDHEIILSVGLRVVNRASHFIASETESIRLRYHILAAFAHLLVHWFSFHEDCFERLLKQG